MADAAQAHAGKRLRHEATAGRMPCSRRVCRVMTRADHLANHSHMYCRRLLADYPCNPPASQCEGDVGIWSALDGGVINSEQARYLRAGL